MSKYFNSYSRYYNLFYQNKNYADEVAYIQKHIIKNKPDSLSILEYGSGSGGHGLLFKELGFQIYGLEQSAEMVSIARSKGFNCEIADITNYQLDEKFDVVLALFHVISYLTTNDKLIAAFNLAARQLKSDGLFIFDVWYTPAVYNLMPENRYKQIEDDEVKVYRSATPTIHYNLNVVDVNYEIKVIQKKNEQIEIIKECHPMRHFTIPEMDLLARLTGFELVHSEEFLTGLIPSENTWGVCFILKRLDQ